jgi:phage tail sheath protein FI
MGFQVSPGVQVKEINATNVIPAVSTSIGAFVGEFNWGPVNEIVTIGSENELGSIFGAPSKTNAKDFLTAGGFLKYGNNLKTVRSVGAAARNAVTGSATTAASINNKSAYDLLSFVAAQGNWIARCPGALGNAIKVHAFHASAATQTSFASWAYAGQFDEAPKTSQFALDNGKTSTFYDEVHILVEDDTGAISGTAGTILEVYPFLSVAGDAKDASGSSIYYADVINNQSEYIFFGNHDVNGVSAAVVVDLAVDSLVVGKTYTITTVGTTDFTAVGAAVGFDVGTVFTATGVGTGTGTATYDDLDSGAAIVGSASGIVETALAEHIDDGNTSDGTVVSTMTLGVSAEPAAADYTAGYDLFTDASSTDISLLFAAPDEAGAITVASKLITIASTRKDCLAIITPPIDSGRTYSGANTWFNTTLNQVSSYATAVGVNAQVYDRYNDQFIEIGLGGHIAGLCASTDKDADPWFSPAGYSRGQLFGITKLMYNATKIQRDTLYKSAINPVVSFPGEGTVLFGDKTLVKRPSAFDRINVRRLFIVLEKAIATAAKYQLFEFNDEFTRAMFKNMTEPFLRNVQGRRGITDFLVKCDIENNDGTIVDNNQFVADIYIKPARSINYIQLNFIATRTGVEFTEIAG